MKSPGKLSRLALASMMLLAAPMRFGGNMGGPQFQSHNGGGAAFGGVGGPVSSLALGMNLAGLDEFNGAYALANTVHNYFQIALASGTATYTEKQGVLTVTAVTGTATFMVVVNAAGGTGLPTSGAPFKFVNPDGMPAGVGGFGSYTLLAKSTLTTPQDVPIPGSWQAGVCLAVNFEVSAPGTYHVPQLWWPGTYGTGAIFNPQFVAWHQTMGTKYIRVMDWVGTNGQLDTDWADRSLTTTPMVCTTGTHMPWEWCIAAANQIGCDLWVCVPARATSAYVTSLAALIQSQLAPGRFVYVEQSNENWNNGSAYYGQRQWIGYWYFTKNTATVNSATGVITTPTAHGLTTGDPVAGFITYNDGLKKLGYTGPGPDNAYLALKGGDLTAQVLSPTTFTVNDAGSNTPISWIAGISEWLWVKRNEAGKTYSPDGNYADLVDRNGQIFEAAMPGRVKVLMGTQLGNLGLTDTLLAKVPGMTRKPDALLVATYVKGIYHCGQLTKGAGTMAPSWWTADRGTSTVYLGRYASGSTPTDAQVIAGTGTGFQAKVSSNVGFGTRNQVPVTITNASPAVVTWDTTAPANGSVVQFQTTGALPTGLAVNTNYYVVNSAGSTFQVSATSGGAAINTTGAGSGTHTALGFLPSGNYLPLAGMSGIANGTYEFPMVVVDSTGMRARFNQTVVIDGSSATLDVIDTYANQTLRNIYDLCCTPTGSGMDGIYSYAKQQAAKIAASSLPTMELWAYESNMHADDVPPTAGANFMDAYSEDASWANFEKMHISTLAFTPSPNLKKLTQFVDISTSLSYGVGWSWAVSDNYADTADQRFIKLSSFGGNVPKNAALDSAQVSGLDIANRPASLPTPTDLYDFGDATYTYSLLNNGQNDTGNFQIAGTKLQLVNDSGVTWTAANIFNIKVIAQGPKGCALVTVHFTLGTSWASNAAKFAFSTKDDATPAALNPTVGNALSPVSTAATAVADGWAMAGASYQGGGATGSMAFTESPLFIIASRTNNDAAIFKALVQFGSGIFVEAYLVGPNSLVLDMAALGTVSVPVDNTLAAVWVWFDNANLKYYYGKNQTILNPGGTSYASQGAAVFGTFTLIGDGNNAMVLAAAESTPCADQTTALSLVQKVQTKHSIP